MNLAIGIQAWSRGTSHKNKTDIIEKNMGSGAPSLMDWGSWLPATYNIYFRDNQHRRKGSHHQVNTYWILNKPIGVFTSEKGMYDWKTSQDYISEDCLSPGDMTDKRLNTELPPVGHSPWVPLFSNLEIKSP